MTFSGIVWEVKIMNVCDTGGTTYDMQYTGQNLVTTQALLIRRLRVTVFYLTKSCF